MQSLSQESLEDASKQKLQQTTDMNRLLEEKRKVREEKQRQAQVQREAMEKERRDQALKIQMEREEKYRKIMKEKEEKQRLETLKKKALKEKQAKKYEEEKKKKEEFVAPKPVSVAEPQSANKDDSLLLKLQKQKLMDKVAQQKKESSKNTYNFDMLHTDDSTDDESKPSKKRPSPPSWSKSEFIFLVSCPNFFIIFLSESTRKPLIVMQSTINQNVMDTLFSAQPISVNLKEIFPAIEPRKLIRNSSAIWRTPPKYNANISK